MSWANFWSWVEYLAPLFRECAVGLAALIGAIVAWRGLGTWREQLHGRTDYELAKRVLRAVYAVRREINQIRSPLTLGHEIAKALADLAQRGIDKPTDEVRDYQLYDNKFQPLQELLLEINELEIEGEAEWGPGVREGLVELRRACSTLHTDIYGWIRGTHRPPSLSAPEPKQRAHLEAMAKMEKTVWCVSADTTDDPFGLRVEAIVEAIEDMMRPKLGRK